ncbi:hypothetical protein A2801_01145 [Candidatus Woesebacteria bacterium RIFCSPHIGHO2_01_FULL_41_10]|uniref:Small ribosomal subunit protein bS21 n=1 Tax=Candidatus Woesebacteria bacterium RIFCSPHIGHO2_01_FULL_41_10 TaxID=1802500 RepID=A0A1F7YNN1_9BACT|nr:MAG: hypothetical protein A2801_01145 [Candidatus Woesebacteria bacterium RIFCSPHIGHO2_01_FULL_41_10]
MVHVKKQKGESDDRLIARFRKKVLDSGILFEFRDNERHKKDSEKRKEKKYRLRHLHELERKRTA